MRSVCQTRLDTFARWNTNIPSTLVKQSHNGIGVYKGRTLCVSSLGSIFSICKCC